MSEKQTARSLAVQLLQEDKSVEQVIAALSRNGVDEIEALEIVAEAIHLSHPVEAPNPRKEGWEDVRNGLLLLAVAGGITAASFAIASGRSHGHYVVASGVLLVSTIYILKGLWRVVRG